MCKCEFLPLRYVYIYTYIMFIHLPNFKRTSSRVPSLHNFSALVFLGVGNSCARRHCVNGPPSRSQDFFPPRIWVYQGFLELQDHAQNSTSLAIRLLLNRFLPCFEGDRIHLTRHNFQKKPLYAPGFSRPKNHDDTSDHVSCLLHGLLTGPAWPSAEDSQVRNSQAASIFPSVPAE